MLIAIDHGNKQIKTVNHEPFTSGLAEYDVRPFGDDVLCYQGKFYKPTDQRIPYRRDKTEDERFFILTLFAIAYEIEARKCDANSVLHVQLAVGLPPAHYGAQHKAFVRYFCGRGEICFQFRGRNYAIYIDDAVCFPQSYAAAITMFKALRESPKALVVDIGGFTADYLQLVNGAADLSTCDSLENGVILLYNNIKSRVNADLDVILGESEIDAVLMGRREGIAPAVVEIVERQTQNFANDLLSALRERLLELKSGKVVFVGGGAILLKRQIEASGKIGSPLFIEDISANARGFEYLYRIVQASR